MDILRILNNVLYCSYHVCPCFSMYHSSLFFFHLHSISYFLMSLPFHYHSIPSIVIQSLSSSSLNPFHPPWPKQAFFGLLGDCRYYFHGGSRITFSRGQIHSEDGRKRVRMEGIKGIHRRYTLDGCSETTKISNLNTNLIY